MKSTRSRWILHWASLALAALACRALDLAAWQGQPAAATSPPQQATATAPTPAMAPSATGAPEPTQKPDIPSQTPPSPATPLPSATATAMPKRLSDRGPWLVAGATSRLYVMDSSGPGALALEAPWGVIHDLQASPAGGLAAVVAADDEVFNGLALYLVVLPTGEITRLSRLLPAGTRFDPTDPLASPYFEPARAVTLPGSLAWSPDGMSLAFVGAQDGPSADVYLYEVAAGSLSRLTDGLSQAFHLSWSPDGRTLVHAGAEAFGTGAGYAMEAAWSIAIETGRVTRLYLARQSFDEVFLGWLDERTVLVHSWYPSCGNTRLRSLDVRSQQETLLWGDFFSAAVLDPLNGAVLINVDAPTAQCNPAGQSGVFFKGAGQPRPTRLILAPAEEVAFSPEVGRFYLRVAAETLELTAARELRSFQSPGGRLPLASPESAWLAYAPGDDSAAGLWLAAYPDGAARQVFTQPVSALTWEPVTPAQAAASVWFISEGVYRAVAPEFEPQLVWQPEEASALWQVWVRP